MCSCKKKVSTAYLGRNAVRRARENNSQGKLSHKREDNSPALATKPCGPHPCLHAAFPRLVQLPALECNANSKLAGEWVQKEGPEKKKEEKSASAAVQTRLNKSGIPNKS